MRGEDNKTLPGMSAEPPAWPLIRHSVNSWVPQVKIVDHWARDSPTPFLFPGL